MDQALITLIILVIVALLFLTEIIPVAVSALSATVALVFFGILTPQEAFSGFSNSNVILFSGMFVVGVAMLESGLAQTIGNFIVRKVVGTRQQWGYDYVHIIGDIPSDFIMENYDGQYGAQMLLNTIGYTRITGEEYIRRVEKARWLMIPFGIMSTTF